MRKGPLQECSGGFSLDTTGFPSPALWTHGGSNRFKPLPEAHIPVWGKAFVCELNQQGGEL